MDIKNTHADILDIARKTRSYRSYSDRSKYMKEYKLSKRWSDIIAIVGESLECPICHKVILESKSWSMRDNIATCKSCKQKGRPGNPGGTVYPVKHVCVTSMKAKVKCNVRGHREGKGISVAELAGMSKVAAKEINLMEAGNWVDLGDANKVLDALGIKGFAV